jgi:single-stranded-DNA-specific exonuclease
MKKSWKFNNIDQSLAVKLEERHGLHSLVAKILLSKGIYTPKDIKEYLFPDPLLRRSPYAFKSMKKAVSKIREHIDNKKRIYIYGDKDVDGVSALALLINFFEKLKVDVFYSVTSKETSYGFSDALVDDIIKNECSLLITVDCGIKENEYAEKLSSLGVDVIITDHHNPPDLLPSCHAIINPKCEEHFSGFEREISGCTVAFKLAEAILLSYLPLLHSKKLTLSLENGGFRGSVIQALNIQEKIAGKSSDLNYDDFDSVFGYKKDIHFLKNIFGDKAFAIEDFASETLKTDIADKLSLSNALNLYEDDYAELISSAYIKLSRMRLSSVERYFNDYADLTGISAICDVMPLVGENRLFVKEGIKSLNNGCRPGIRELNREINFYTGPISESRIGMYIGPAINSAGRLGSADVSLELLLDSKAKDATLNAKNLVQINKERKKIADNAFKNALSFFDDITGEKSLFYKNDEIPSGITGILAQKISKHFNRPSVVLSEEEGVIIGSARTNDSTNVLEAITAAEKHLLQYGGHEGACGFSFHKNSLEDVKGLIKDYFDSKTKVCEKELNIVCELFCEELNINTAKNIAALGPYGEKNPSPVFVLKSVEIRDLKEIANKSARFKISGCEDIGCLGWGLYEDVKSLSLKDSPVDIAFTVEINYFRGRESVQLVLEDIH